MEIVRIRYFSATHFSAIEQNIERYSVSLRIQSEFGKIRTRKTPNTVVLRTLSNICGEALCENSQRLFSHYLETSQLICSPNQLNGFFYDGDIGREKINYFCQNCYHKCLTGLKCASELYGRPHLTRTLYFSLGQKNFYASLRYLKNV